MTTREIAVGKDLTVVQNILLDAMDQIHNLCEETGIVYYLIGGSALGAVRHKGFIPWDVDIDIAMHREDYDRFAEIAEKRLPPGLSFHDYKNTPKYYSPHATVCVDDVCAIIDPNYYREAKLGNLLVDIFPLDNAPDDEELREKQARELKRLVRIHSRKECVLYKRNTLIQVLIKKMIRIALLPYSLERLEARRDAILTRYDADDTKCWCSMVSHYPYTRQCMDKEIYGVPVKMEFAGRMYYVPHKTEAYLTRIFGEHYMELPPVEKRVRPGDLIEKIIITERKIK